MKSRRRLIIIWLDSRSCRPSGCCSHLLKYKESASPKDAGTTEGGTSCYTEVALESEHTIRSNPASARIIILFLCLFGPNAHLGVIELDDFQQRSLQNGEDLLGGEQVLSFAQLLQAQEKSLRHHHEEGGASDTSATVLLPQHSKLFQLTSKAAGKSVLLL